MPTMYTLRVESSRTRRLSRLSALLILGLSYGFAGFSQENKRQAPSQSPSVDTAVRESVRKLFLDEISVTASPLPKELRQIASSVSILSKGAPELQQIQSIDEALAFLPGVMVDRSRGLTTTGTHTGVILRGTGAANRTLILKDGVPINDAYTGGASEWNSLAANSIERIEVVRGPGSSIYGASSMGGTINLVTQLPGAKPELGADFRYGSMDTYQSSVKLGKRCADRREATAFAEYKQTDVYAFLADVLWNDNYQIPKMSLLNVNGKLKYDLDNGAKPAATADVNQQEPRSGTGTIYDDRTF